MTLAQRRLMAACICIAVVLFLGGLLVQHLLITGTT